MSDGISQFSSFMDRPWCFGSHVAGYSSGKGELLEELLHPFFVLCDVRIEFGVASLQIRVGDQARASMTGAGNVNDIQIQLLDQPVKMNVDKIQSRGRAPMA